PSLLETWGLADSLLAQAAQRSLAPEVRSCVEETLRRRYQNAPTLDLRPICEVLPGVSAENRAAARLALLAATAPYRIGPTDLAQAGDAGPCGQRWVDIVAFGAHTRIRALSQVLSSKVVGSP